MRQNEEAENSLKQALAVEPGNMQKNSMIRLPTGRSAAV
jgi:hypothetical protein